MLAAWLAVTALLGVAGGIAYLAARAALRAGDDRRLDDVPLHHSSHVLCIQQSSYVSTGIIKRFGLTAPGSGTIPRISVVAS